MVSFVISIYPPQKVVQDPFKVHNHGELLDLVFILPKKTLYFLLLGCPWVSNDR